MSRIAYVNGRYLHHGDARVHVEDRGYQFADGVYEICEIWNGMIVDERMHLDRLERSLREMVARYNADALFSRALRKSIIDYSSLPLPKGDEMPWCPPSACESIVTWMPSACSSSLKRFICSAGARSA